VHGSVRLKHDFLSNKIRLGPDDTFGPRGSSGLTLPVDATDWSTLSCVQYRSCILATRGRVKDDACHDVNSRGLLRVGL